MEKRITAYHEAGHVIACDEFNIACGVVTITPNEERETAGHCMHAEDAPYECFKKGKLTTDEIKAIATWNEQHAIVGYAGHAALVALLNIGGMSDISAAENGAGQDFEKANERLGLDPERMGRAKAEALRIVTARRDDVEKVADALLKLGRLNDAQVDWVLIRGLPLPDHLAPRAGRGGAPIG